MQSRQPLPQVRPSSVGCEVRSAAIGTPPKGLQPVSAMSPRGGLVLPRCPRGGSRFRPRPDRDGVPPHRLRDPPGDPHRWGVTSLVLSSAGNTGVGRAMPGRTERDPDRPVSTQPRHSEGFLLGVFSEVVGAAGFGPATSCAQGRRATRLRYAPTDVDNSHFIIPDEPGLPKKRLSSDRPAGCDSVSLPVWSGPRSFCLYHDCHMRARLVSRSWTEKGREVDRVDMIGVSDRDVHARGSTG